MQWVISDIHGCLDEYMELLALLQLGMGDRLYVLGDAIDRGPQPVAVLRDVLTRPGIVYVPGNHDYFLRQLGPSYGFTAREGRSRPSLFDRLLYAGWMLDGGRSTLSQFRSLPAAERRRLLALLESAPAVVECSAGNEAFVLVHKAVPGFLSSPRFADWGLQDFLGRSPDYTRPLLSDGRTVVSGHKWTAEIRPDGSSTVYTAPGHLAIDCGCAFGGRLAACCLETGEQVYVNSKQR